MSVVERLKQTAQRGLRSLGYEVYRSGAFERMREAVASHEFDHMWPRLRFLAANGVAPATIWDVGASNGRWTRRCLPIFPTASFFCVEPLGEHEGDLKALRREHGNVGYWIGCLGAGQGSITLNADGAGSSILPGHLGNRYGEQRDVKLSTLDALVSEGLCAAPDLLKIDVQGYELEVLAGAVRSLATTQAVIAEMSFTSFQEGMPLIHEVIAWMADRGFVVADILSLSVRPLDQQAAQSDVLFLKKDHPLRQDNRWDRDSVY